SRNACIWSTSSTTSRRSCAFSASSRRSRNLRSSSPVISEFHSGGAGPLKACPFDPPLSRQARSRASAEPSTLLMNHPPPSPSHPSPKQWFDGNYVFRNAPDHRPKNAKKPRVGGAEFGRKRSKVSTAHAVPDENETSADGAPAM